MRLFGIRRTVSFGLKLYVCIALVLGAVFSDPITSVTAVVSLLLFLAQQWRQVNRLIDVLTSFFVFFALATLWEPTVKYLFANVIALPVLILVAQSMLAAQVQPTQRQSRFSRVPTKPAVVLVVITLVVVGIALVLSNTALLLSSAIVIIYLGALTGLSLTMPVKSMETELVHFRVLAGSHADVHLTMHVNSRTKGFLHLIAPYQWLNLHPQSLDINGKDVSINVSISPPLSGPAVVELTALFTDRWGLVQTRFYLDVLRLHVIPRARYASWLARKYMDTTKPGALPLVANVSTVKPQFGLRQGIEYYGSQLYQPGDSLRSIDWKHSAKYNELITKEYIEAHGQPATLLVNLSARDADEADRLAQKTIMTAISLAQEQIPTIIAAYDHQEVRFVTPVLQMQQIVVRSLEMTRDIIIFDNPVTYLFTPDLSRIRANIYRLKSVADEPAVILSELLALEYSNLIDGVMRNPVTQALHRALDSGGRQSTIVFISELNHDINAIAINRFLMENRGYAVAAI